MMMMMMVLTIGVGMIGDFARHLDDGKIGDGDSDGHCGVSGVLVVVVATVTQLASLVGLLHTLTQ